MTIARIRKMITVVDETHTEMGQQINPPTRKAAAIAVIENPFASQYIEDRRPGHTCANRGRVGHNSWKTLY